MKKLRLYHVKGIDEAFRVKAELYKINRIDYEIVVVDFSEFIPKVIFNIVLVQQWHLLNHSLIFTRRGVMPYVYERLLSDHTGFIHSIVQLGGRTKKSRRKKPRSKNNAQEIVF